MIKQHLAKPLSETSTRYKALQKELGKLKTELEPELELLKRFKVDCQQIQKYVEKKYPQIIGAVEVFEFEANKELIDSGVMAVMPRIIAQLPLEIPKSDDPGFLAKMAMNKKILQMRSIMAQSFVEDAESAFIVLRDNILFGLSASMYQNDRELFEQEQQKAKVPRNNFDIFSNLGVAFFGGFVGSTFGVVGGLIGGLTLVGAQEISKTINRKKIRASFISSLESANPEKEYKPLSQRVAIITERAAATVIEFMEIYARDMLEFKLAIGMPAETLNF